MSARARRSGGARPLGGARAAACALVATCASRVFAAPNDPPPYKPPPFQVELGPTLTYETRSTVDDRAHNPAGIRYGAALAPGVFVRATFLPWLLGAVAFRSGSHDLTLPAGALGVSPGRSFQPQSDVNATQLDAYVQPTWPIAPRLRVWATVGMGWGRLTLPTILVDPSAPPAVVLRSRAGVFLETPLGLGGGVEVVPHLLTISYDARYEPIFLPQTGTMYDHDVYVDRQGALRDLAPMPKVGHAVSQTLSIALAL